MIYKLCIARVEGHKKACRSRIGYVAPFCSVHVCHVLSTHTYSTSHPIQLLLSPTHLPLPLSVSQSVCLLHMTDSPNTCILCIHHHCHTFRTLNDKYVLTVTVAATVPGHVEVTSPTQWCLCLPHTPLYVCKYESHFL